MTGLLDSINVTHALIDDPHGDLDRTGIDKRPVDREVLVGWLGLIGDQQYDKRFHGGIDAAIYAYAREDYDDWQTDLGRTLANGQFGENLTTTGVDVNGALVGEVWRVGSQVTLRARSPRIPCRTFQGFVGEEHWVKRFTQRGKPGTYFSVLTQGAINPGDVVEVIERPDHGLTIADLFAIISGAREPEILDRARAAADHLTDEDREHVAKFLG